MLSLSSLRPVTERQLGLFTARQARDVGITDHQLHSAIRAGLIRRVRRSVYAIEGVPRSREQAILAGVLGAGDGAFASHETAALLFGMGRIDPPEIEIIVPRGRFPQLEGVRLHRSRFLARVDVTTRNGVPTTTPARTLVDLSTRLSVAELGIITDEAIRRKQVRLVDIERARERMSFGTGWDRSKRIDTMTAARRGIEPGGSDKELVVRSWCIEAGLPVPTQQIRVATALGDKFVDMGWLPYLVGVEFNGFADHGSFTAFHDDAKRELALEARGWHLVNLTAHTPKRLFLASVEKVLLDRGWPGFGAVA